MDLGILWILKILGVLGISGILGLGMLIFESLSRVSNQACGIQSKRQNTEPLVFIDDEKIEAEVNEKLKSMKSVKMNRQPVQLPGKAAVMYCGTFLVVFILSYK